jgi:hypothetical protein
MPDEAALKGNIIGQLLKAPLLVMLKIMSGKNLLMENAKLLGSAAVCYAVFGLSIGLFGGWQVAAMSVMKVPLIALCSMLLCFPSLYVFTAVLGSPMTFGQAFALGSACLAMTGLILVGLAPVAWLFSVSTASLGFVVVMTIVIWVVAMSFAGNFLGRAREVGLLKRGEGLGIWFVILAVVMLQMTTVMRPILTAPKKNESGITAEKKFFMRHFADSFDLAKPDYRNQERAR